MKRFAQILQFSKKIILIGLLGFVMLNGGAQELSLYVGTFTSEGAEGMYLCTFDTETGNLKLAKTFKGIDNPSFFDFSPNHNFLYAVTRAPEKIEKSGGYLSAYKILKDGSLKFINKQKSNGAGPCYVEISADGKYAAIATYGGGTTSLFAINEDGSLEPASSVVVNKGAGSDPARQDKPHAHSIRFSPFTTQVFSADLGTDKINIYEIENQKLIPSNPKYLALPPGAGPRHFEWYKNKNVLFVINELNSTISTFKNQNGLWENTQNISTLPADFNGKSYCADIHLSADGKFLYGSNRGHNSISVFSVDAKTQALSLIETVDIKGNWPRNFTLSPNGDFLLVANQYSHNITIFRINKNNGVPVFTGKQLKIPAPVCLKFR